MVLNLLIQIGLLAPFVWLRGEQVDDRALIVRRPVCEWDLELLGLT
jgi:hypothetical protein